MKDVFFRTAANDVVPESFGAFMLSYEVGATPISDGYLQAENRAFPVRLKGKRGLRSIRMVFDFEHDSDHERALNISRFTYALQKGTVDLRLPDGFHYWCEYDGATTPQKMAPWIEQVEFQLTGIRHEELRRHTLTASGIIDADGNQDSPIIATLTPAAGVSVMQFMGITINSSRPVTIDGVYTTVLDSTDANVFSSTDITEWPKLAPGKNQIQMAGIESAAVSYYPIWI